MSSWDHSSTCYSLYQAIYLCTCSHFIKENSKFLLALQREIEWINNWSLAQYAKLKAKFKLLLIVVHVNSVQELFFFHFQEVHGNFSQPSAILQA